MSTRLNTIINYIAWIFSGLFTLASVLISLNRYWQYEIFYYDFGIFDRAIWLVSRFQAPIIDHLVVGIRTIFADHFNPSIFLYTPIYWLTNKSEALLIAQSATVGLSGLIVYKIGKLITKNNLFSLSILTSYFLFVGLQNALVSDFHEVTVATLFLALCFYFFLKNRKYLTFLFFIITLGFKESNFLMGAGLAITFFLLNKSWRKFSFFLFLFAIAYGFLAIKLIIPYFSGGIYGYSVPLSVEKLNIFEGLLGAPDKQRVVFQSLLSFGFLPLLSPTFWFLTVQDFLVRFLSGRVSLGLHYSALLSVIMAISSCYGFKNLIKFRFFKKYHLAVCLLILLNSVFLYRFVLRGPFALSYNPAFYSHTKDFKFLDEIISKVPHDASIKTHNNLASHFAHNKNVWILEYDYDSNNPDYILIDLRTGQNVNNFFLTKYPELILKDILNDKNYSTLYNNRDQYLFRRK